jgi:predicted membrane-bound spermidine synthase
MMAFLRSVAHTPWESFSFLYLANVIGAMTGASVTALVLIELYGFRKTLLLAAAINILIGIVAYLLPLLARRSATGPVGSIESATVASAPSQVVIGNTMRLVLLFTTGFTSLAMEVVWTRAFTPVLRTTIYAFAALLSVYLLATWVGSAFYRFTIVRQSVWRIETLLGAVFATSMLPLVVNDPRWHHRPSLVLASIVPISALLGYVTPRLVDEHSRGEPRAAGSAYAVNVAGCIAGPLFAGYVLLPAVGVKWSLVLLAASFGALWVFAARRTGLIPRLSPATAGAALLLVGVTYTVTYETPHLYRQAVVHRDHTATVVAYGEGMRKRLLVNGVGITYLTPITKFMAHLPLVFRREPPRSTLVICFGMGTTFRSLATWEGRTTAVELVPSVLDAFDFFFPDAPSVLAAQDKQVVIDDGRRFLKRTTERFDVITLDPPPPVEAAGSSLLYSIEFYRTLRERLSPTGVLQQWFPGGEGAIEAAVASSLKQVFPHVKVFRSIEGWGHHFIASEQPLETPAVEQVLTRMPPAATRDLMEWYPLRNPEEVWREMLAQEVDVQTLVGNSSRLAVTDDRPFNEYFWLRRSLDWLLISLKTTS